jgi:uncharacterized membrane protein YhaH (DUF805 family)
MLNTFMGSLKKYVDFSGRATRKEFWTYVFFYYLLSFSAGLIDGFLQLDFVGSLVVLGLTIPYISCAARRMHDVGKSGWFMIVPIYNFILALTPTVPEKSE